MPPPPPPPPPPHIEAWVGDSPNQAREGIIAEEGKGKRRTELLLRLQSPSLPNMKSGVVWAISTER